MKASSVRRAALGMSLLLFGLAGCAGGGTTAPREGGARRASNRIEAAELATVSELDAYEAISRLRPAWLRAGTRGSVPEVVVDGAPQRSGLDMLRSLRAGDVTLLEFMSAADATTRFGTGYASGAIVVTTRR